jgi:hypothetical protein
MPKPPQTRKEIESELEDLEDALEGATDTGIARWIVVRIKELRRILGKEIGGERE